MGALSWMIWVGPVESQVSLEGGGGKIRVSEGDVVIGRGQRDVATSQGVQAASRNWKRQGGGFFP